jgi:hypothetical protein
LPETDFIKPKKRGQIGEYLGNQKNRGKVAKKL